jgi:ABC-type nitrate/sulfonate/bicarbonate transport system permease component
MRMTEGLLTRTVQILFVAAVFLAWFAATETGHVHFLLLPPIDKVLVAMGRLATSGRLWKEASVTLMEVFYAYLAAAVPGLLIGFAVSRSQAAVRFFEPIFSGIFTVPLTLFLPLFIFFFGIGPTGKVTFGGVYAFFPVVITSIAAFSGVDRLHIAAARSMGASEWQMLRRVYFPSAWPGIITGLRIATIVCIASVLGAETVSAISGLGRSIAYTGELMDSVQMYAWILYVVMIAIAINLLLAAAELRASARR